MHILYVLVCPYACWITLRRLVNTVKFHYGDACDVLYVHTLLATVQNEQQSIVSDDSCIENT